MGQLIKSEMSTKLTVGFIRKEDSCKQMNRLTLNCDKRCKNLLKLAFFETTSIRDNPKASTRA